MAQTEVNTSNTESPRTPIPDKGANDMFRTDVENVLALEKEMEKARAAMKKAEQESGDESKAYETALWEYEYTNGDYSDKRAELCIKFLDWVVDVTGDPEPDEPCKTPEFFHAIAERAYNLAKRLEPKIADMLTDFADEWATMTSRDVYGY